MKTIAFVLFAALFIILFIEITDAQAATVSCTETRVINGYGHVNQQTEIDPLSKSSFQEFRCRVEGMRLYKSKANTISEVKELHAFAADYAGPHHHIAFCKWDGGAKATMIDRRYYYAPRIKAFNDRERDDYGRWVKRYSSNHGCRVLR